MSRSFYAHAFLTKLVYFRLSLWTIHKILTFCFVDSGSKPENGSLETRIRFYLEGVFLPGIGVIGILGKLCLVSYLHVICVIAGNILSLHILRTANLELKPGQQLSRV